MDFNIESLIRLDPINKIVSVILVLSRPAIDRSQLSYRWFEFQWRWLLCSRLGGSTELRIIDCSISFDRLLVTIMRSMQIVFRFCWCERWPLRSPLITLRWNMSEPLSLVCNLKKLLSDCSPFPLISFIELTE